MKAFNNDIEIKNNLIAQLQAHYDADEIVKGVYWKNGKGGAIGCAIHSGEYSSYEQNCSLYEQKYSIPQWLVKVQDRIFDGLPNKKLKEWPLLFTKSVNLGSDLDKIRTPFLIFLVESTLDKFDHKRFPKVKRSIDNVLTFLKKYHANADADSVIVTDAVDAAHTVTSAAAAAAGHAAAAAASYAAGAAVFYAAYAETESFREEQYEKFADKLIELISSATS